MSDPQRATRFSRWRIPVGIYIVCLGLYSATSAGWIKRPTSDNHYVYLAHDLLHGRLSLQGAPPHGNDWSLVTELTLKSGRRLRGTFLQTGGAGEWFKTTRGERLSIPKEEIRERRDVHYVSFPWFPAVLMLPFVAIWGMKLNDVIFTLAFAALNPVLLYLLLRRLEKLGMSARTVVEDLWLVGAFAFGTVHFFSSVQGSVWYTAHVIGTGLTAVYALAALQGRHPLVAGACLGLGFVTRTPIPFSFPLIVGEVLRKRRRDGDPSTRAWPPSLSLLRSLDFRGLLRDGALIALPALVVLATAGVFNYLRFDSPTEFGHYYLNVRWTERIQRWGLFNYHFLARNLAVMFCLLPKISLRHPHVQISMHGLSIFFTTPLFLYLLRSPTADAPAQAQILRPWLWLSVLLPAILHLLYQNSGWVQFGYRFSLDYTVYLMALFALGGYRLGKWAKVLIIWGVIVNTFGAISFNRLNDYYWDGMFPVP